MQGIISPHAAEVIATISVGVLVVYFSVHGILALVDGTNDNESDWRRTWRFIAGIGCGIIGLGIGLTIILAMSNEAGVIAVCQVNGFNPVAVLLFLFFATVFVAFLNNVLLQPPQSRADVKLSTR